jgi:hypothetical protein
MPKSRTATIDTFRSALTSPVELDALLAKAGQRDRTNVEKHLAALDAGPDAQHASLWRRVTRSLATLAPLAITTIGQQAVQFFIADGKYRMQVFALEDQHDGKLQVYLPDVLAEAIKMKVIAKDDHSGLEEERYAIVAVKAQTLHIEQLDAANTANPAPHYKNMLGWNRKALRVTVPITATSSQIDAIEDMAAIAAKSWAGKQQPAAEA